MTFQRRIWCIASVVICIGAAIGSAQRQPLTFTSPHKNTSVMEPFQLNSLQWRDIQDAQSKMPAVTVFVPSELPKGNTLNFNQYAVESNGRSLSPVLTESFTNFDITYGDAKFHRTPYSVPFRAVYLGDIVAYWHTNYLAPHSIQIGEVNGLG